ncbi:MAG: flagellar protein FlgN [Pseudomonadota bacterium]
MLTVVPDSGESVTHRRARELQRSLEEAVDCVDHLLRVLHNERDALSAGNVEQLDYCGQQKADCVVQLETVDSRRAQQCRELGIRNDDIDEFLAAHKCSDGTSWQHFTTRLASCRDANSLNNALVRIRRGHIEKALGILRGASGDTPLYGPDGLDTPSGSPLGRA